MAGHIRWVTLNRDCEAMIVPSGMPFLIPANTGVEITQAKGGSITVNINGQLARIDAKDADALGVELAELVLATNSPNNNEKEAEGPVNLEQVWDQIRTCYDPEIPVNVVDLGLIYDCRVEASADLKHNHVFVNMTLTAPGCGMGPVIMQDVESAVWRVKNVTAVTVEMVFDPVWDREMISEAGKLELGLL